MSTRDITPRLRPLIPTKYRLVVRIFVLCRNILFYTSCAPGTLPEPTAGAGAIPPSVEPHPPPPGDPSPSHRPGPSPPLAGLSNNISSFAGLRPISATLLLCRPLCDDAAGRWTGPIRSTACPVSMLRDRPVHPSAPYSYQVVLLRSQGRATSYLGHVSDRTSRRLVRRLTTRRRNSKARSHHNADIQSWACIPRARYYILHVANHGSSTTTRPGTPSTRVLDATCLQPISSQDTILA